MVQVTDVSQALAPGLIHWIKRGSQKSMELLFANVILTDFLFFIQMFGIVCIWPDILAYLL